MRLRKNKTFVFLRFLALTDLVALYFWNINHFTVVILNLDLQNYNIWLCKFGQFYQFSSLQISAWILVI